MITHEIQEWDHSLPKSLHGYTKEIGFNATLLLEFVIEKPRRNSAIGAEPIIINIQQYS